MPLPEITPRSGRATVARSVPCSMRSLLVVALLALAACRDSTAPKQTSCDPNKNPKDSVDIPFVGDSSSVIIRIKWCGPITVGASRMTEQHPIPAISQSAFNLLKADYERGVNLLAQQTAQVMGLANARVDFGAGVVTTDVPDIQPDIAPKAG